MALNPNIPMAAGQIESPLMALGRGLQAGQQMASTAQQMQRRKDADEAAKAAGQKKAGNEAAEQLREALAGTFTKMKALPIEQREAFKLQAAEEIKQRYNIDIPQAAITGLQVDDASLDAELAGLLGQKQGITVDQQLRRREVVNKEERLTFEREQAAAELTALDSAIDQLDVDEKTKRIYKNLPREQKERQVELSLDPAKKRKLLELDAKNAQIKQEIASFAATLSSPNFADAVGLLDNLTTTIGGLWGSEDAQLNNKINRQSKSFVIKMAKSLGANPTDRDMKILLESIPSTWQQPEDWHNWFNDEAVPIFNARAIALGLDPIAEIVGGDKPDASGAEALSRGSRLQELRAKARGE